MPSKILIVEDDADINELIAMNLQLMGHVCTRVYDGNDALKAIEESAPDLVLLDIMLPGLDGFEIMERISGVPVIFITAKDGLQNKIAGLSAGADDYIVKPFEMLEMIARVDAVLRRTQKSGDVFILDGVTVNLTERSVKKDGGDPCLTPKEFELLEVLIAHKNIAMSREKLLSMAWGYDFEGETRTVDYHISKLKSKLGWENRIKTVYKFGYRLEVTA
ncbi:MAG: response regulator transcription factor [Defluviitaleaceae bacterium]|nr:response regulator transcription factor [Defluviitaleaceae bacterium]MCL2263061.1 response regulator transcription factor [Defluviitaleaceae bacterium]